MRGNVKTGASYNSPTEVFKYGFKVGINYIRMIMTGVLLYRHETSAILKTGFDLVVPINFRNYIESSCYKINV